MWWTDLQLQRRVVGHHRRAFPGPDGVVRQQENLRPSGRVRQHPERDLQRHGRLPVHLQPHPELRALRVLHRRQQAGAPHRRGQGYAVTMTCPA